MKRDSNLLLGVYAIRMGFTTAERVMEAAAQCLENPTLDLADRLVESGALSSSTAGLLRGLAGVAAEEEGDNAVLALRALDIPDTRRLSGIDAPSDESNPDASPIDADDVPLLIELCGRYKHEMEYARGGMGRVMFVHDRILGRDVALKEILTDPDRPAREQRAKADLERRFVQEAQITGQLEHPSIVPVYELGRRPDGRPYYVMKLVQGKSLREVLKKATSLNERLKLLPRYLDLCQAIAYAHSRGIIHRDIKSANVLLGQFGETAVIDWGLAKSRHGTDHHASSFSEAMRLLQTEEVSDELKTAFGAALGTPAYMAPEQAAGQLDRIDERSDIYSLGVVLFEVLTGEVPFNASSLTDAVRKVVAGERRPVLELEPEAPPELIGICDRATNLNPADRYQTAMELLENVESFYNVWQADESLRAAYRELQETHDHLQIARANELRALEEARTALDRAERDLYLASIQLAANRVSEHRFDLARGALAEAPANERHWEWGYLVSRAFPYIEAPNPETEAHETTGTAAEHWCDATAREVVSIKAHGAYVTNVCPDLKHARLLTSAADGTARLWEFPQGRMLNTFSEGADVLQGAAMSHAGELIATTRTYHSTARVWDVSTGEPLRDLSGHREPVGEIRFSSDDSRLVTASADHTAKLWDVATGAVLTTFSGHEAPVFDACFADDALQIVTASADGTVRRWDALTGNQTDLSKVPAERPLVSMRLSHCLRYCLCAFSDGSGLVWSIQENKIRSTHSGRIGRLDKPGFSGDSTCFVAPAATGGANIYNASTGELLATVGDRHEVLHAAVFDSTGAFVFTGAVDGTVKAWSVTAPESLNPSGLLRGHDDVVYFAEFSPDGTRLVTASYDRTACVWDAATGELLARLEGHASELQSAVFTANGRYIVTGSWDLTRIVWDATTYQQLCVIEGKRTTRKAEFFGGARSEYNLGNAAILGRPIGPESRMLLVRDNQLSHDGWDITSGRQAYTLSGHTKPLTTQAFSPDGRLACTGSMSGETIIWDLATGSEVRRLRGHRAGVTFADFTIDGSRIVTSSLDRTAIIWDIPTGDALVTMLGHNGLVKTARFSPCGKRLVTSSVDTTAIVWDAETGARLATLIGHRGRMLDAMFSPDGRRVLTADYEMARVWDLEGHELVALPAAVTLIFATWSPDGRRIVTCDKDGTARVWNSISWHELETLGGEEATLEHKLQLRRAGRNG